MSQTKKLTPAEYLELPLEEVIKNANHSGHPSEIPFVQLVLSARANQDQKLAAKYTLWTALASLLVAICSPALIYWHQSQQTDAYKTELTLLASKHEALSQKMHQSELDRVRLIEQVAALTQSQMITVKPLIKDFSKKN